MKKYKLINIIAVLLFVSTFSAQAQEERNQGIIWSYLHGWEYGIKAGFSIGGTAPLPLPEEIRKIDSYSPGGLAISIEGNATKWFDTKWGMTVGVRLENKNMTTEATGIVRYEFLTLVFTPPVHKPCSSPPLVLMIFIP